MNIPGVVWIITQRGYLAGYVDLVSESVDAVLSRAEKSAHDDDRKSLLWVTLALPKSPSALETMHREQQRECQEAG